MLLPSSTELSLLAAKLAGQLWWSSSSVQLALVNGKAACAAPKHWGLSYHAAGMPGPFFCPVPLQGSTVAARFGISGCCKRRRSGGNLITGFPSATVR